MALFDRQVEITIRFRVNREVVPGLFYDPQDFADKTAEDVLFRLKSYEPVILEQSIKGEGID